MTKIFEFQFPQIGETASSGIIVRWLKQEKEFVTQNEPLLEVSTDKIATEITSPVSGILQEIVLAEGTEVIPGEILAKINMENSLASEENKEDQLLFSTTTEMNSFEEQVCVKNSGKESFNFSPAVMLLIQREGISPCELKKIQGTGDNGRVTKKDIEKYLAHKVVSDDLKNPEFDFSVFESVAIQKPLQSNLLKEARIPMTPLRQAIASSISKSSDEVPHASLVIDVDFTDLMNLITKEKERFFAVHKVKLTVTSFIIQALAQVLQQYPLLNSFLDEDTIVVKHAVNVGVAVNINKEGVVVPVLKNCQERNLVSLAQELSDLVNRARIGKLNVAEVREGTVTLTNFGMTGALLGIPIIRHPEVAIIGVGTIKKTVVVKDDDSFAIRKVAYLTLTFDHRILDGIYGSEFLSMLKNRLESVTLG